jgi:glycyl-tRNA synthetase beta chain
MSEFFLELFSEEIPSNLQQNLRDDLLKSFTDLFFRKINFI